MKGSPEKILTFLKLSDCLFTVEHGQKINSYNFSRMKYPNDNDDDSIQFMVTRKSSLFTIPSVDVRGNVW